VLKYIGLPHRYGRIDCISLIQLFYKEELNLHFDLPAYDSSKRWVLNFTSSCIDDWALKYAIKTSLTDSQNYDLIVFKCNKKHLINHFGMFLMPNRMLHIEENSTSKTETLSDYWISSIYAIYRHKQLVQ
jgi:cell wall-associated NlpC family hydrolase